MKHLSLAARYRPQTFGEVVGQEMATKALSRAAAELRVAPAYLLSGTRGVGKTTIARIFAKALNCAAGPAPEPCNACPQCRHIMAGNHVDVCEIDGASNTGVDDVRALRENLGFLPMEGRYKIFIVDEAHMLSKSAFNALLKTLEEPPEHAVFIFATTEAHRFPATIVSRCQHFVFRHLSEGQISSHLARILTQEGIQHEEAAIKMLAKRAAGSVRDSLSLLDQVLALGGGELSGAATRAALGLVGREFFAELFDAIASSDCARIVALCGQILRDGADIGFFLRELAGYLRNFFLLRQSGDGILGQLGLADDEARFLKDNVAAFGLAHLHAAWQMVLESQRGILQSMEPAAALELLLLNLALLPRLLPLGEAPLAAPKGVSQGSASASPPADKGAASQDAERQGSPSLSWDGFLDFCAREAAEDAPPKDVLKPVRAQWQQNRLVLTAPTQSLWERLQKHRGLLNAALLRYCQGSPPEVSLVQPKAQRTHAELLQECANNPQVRLCAEIFSGSVTDCREKGNPPADPA